MHRKKNCILKFKHTHMSEMFPIHTHTLQIFFAFFTNCLNYNTNFVFYHTNTPVAAVMTWIYFPCTHKSCVYGKIAKICANPSKFPYKKPSSTSLFEYSSIELTESYIQHAIIRNIFKQYIIKSSFHSHLSHESTLQLIRSERKNIV